MFAWCFVFLKIFSRRVLIHVANSVMCTQFDFSVGVDSSRLSPVVPSTFSFYFIFFKTSLEVSLLTLMGGLWEGNRQLSGLAGNKIIWLAPISWSCLHLNCTGGNHRPHIAKSSKYSSFPSWEKHYGHSFTTQHQITLLVHLEASFLVYFHVTLPLVWVARSLPLPPAYESLLWFSV